MSILELFGVLIVLGVAAWVVQNLAPMSEPFKKGFHVLCVIIVLFLFLNVFFGVGPVVNLWPSGWSHGKH